MDKGKTTTYVVIIPALIALIIEIFFFNFRTFGSIGYEEIVYPVDEIKVQGATAFDEGVYRMENEGYAVIYLQNIPELMNGRGFHDLRLDILLPEAKDEGGRESACMYVTPYIRDEGHDQYDTLAEHVYREDIEDSKYLWVTASGAVKSIALNCRLSEGSIFQIRSIVINAKKDLSLSPVRILILLIVAYTVFILRKNSILWKDGVLKKKRNYDLIAAALGICLIVPALVINISDGELLAIKDFRPYQRLAEALADGQLNLKEAPSEKLAQISNPFDPTLRDAAGLVENVDFLWDMAYFEGQYYCYFGPVPCVLFYLPVYLLTGRHLSDGILMMVLAVFAYAGIYMAMKEWIRKHSADISYAYLLLFTGMIFAGSGMMANISSPDAHDIPRAAGLVFIAWGLYFWQYSVRTDRRGLKSIPIAAGSLCMALSVGCRPNQLFYSFIAIPLFASYLRTGDGFEKKDRTRSLLALMIPYIPVAAALMAYNIMRFGSVTDFGYDYQLTVLDYSKKNILLDRIVIGLYEYLIRLPELTYYFPFMEKGSFDQINEFGHGSFFYTFSYSGLFTSNLLAWCIPGIFAAKKKDIGGIWLLGLSAVNMIVNICVAGVAYHYRVDFAAVILAVGAIGAVRLKEIMGKEGEELIKGFLITAFVLSVMYHSCFYYSDSLRAGNTALYYRLAYAWMR